MTALKLQSTMKGSQANLESKFQQAQSQQHPSSLDKLLDLHQQLQEAMPHPASISFEGLPSGELLFTQFAEAAVAIHAPFIASLLPYGP